MCRRERKGRKGLREERKYVLNKPGIVEFLEIILKILRIIESSITEKEVD